MVTIDDTIHEHVVVFSSSIQLQQTYIQLPCTLEDNSQDISYDLWIEDDSNIWFTFEQFDPEVTSDATVYNENINSAKSYLQVTVNVSDADPSVGDFEESTLITLDAEWVDIDGDTHYARSYHKIVVIRCASNCDECYYNPASAFSNKVFCSKCKISTISAA